MTVAIRVLLTVLLLGSALSGCDALVSGKGGKDERTAEKSKAKAKAPATATPALTSDGEPVKVEKPKDPLDLAIEAQESYVYNPIGKKDPFRSFLEVIIVEDPVTPLQRFDLDQLKLVGVIWGIDRPRALVEDPERVGHVVETGTYMGKHWGKISQITSSGIVVTEEYLTGQGDLVVTEIPMSLQDNSQALLGSP